jgi:hypothetical protein
MSTQSSNNRPIHTVRHGRIKATVWVNPTQKGPMYNVNLSRSYTDEEGNWHDSQSFGFDDLMTVAKCSFDAHTWISTERAKNSTSSDEQADEKPTPKKGASRQPAAS